MKYDISLFVADYPKIDPNITNSRQSLIDTGHLIMLTDSQYHNDARDIFGINTFVSQLQYDMQRIQKDYGMKNIPIYHRQVDEYIVFKNATENVRLRQDRAAKYIVGARVERSVVHHIKIARWCDQGDMLQFLAGSILAERQLQMQVGGTYLLSEEQLKTICKMTHSDKPLNYYKKDCPAIFITIQSQ